jgi:glycine dehydrogenase subunit 1
MAYGGPLLGLFASKGDYLRQIPGRVSGRTVDADGNVGYTMAAQTREQHIRRERATSNICTNSALCALAATVYLATVGATGLRRVAELCVEKAHYLADRIAALDGFELPFSGAFFNEFVVRVPGDANALHRRLLGAGFLVDSPDVLRVHGVEDALRIAVTEKRSREELDGFVDHLGGGG